MSVWLPTRMCVWRHQLHVRNRNQKFSCSLLQTPSRDFDCLYDYFMICLLVDLFVLRRVFSFTIDHIEPSRCVGLHDLIVLCRLLVALWCLVCDPNGPTLCWWERRLYATSKCIPANTLFFTSPFLPLWLFVLNNSCRVPKRQASVIWGIVGGDRFLLGVCSTLHWWLDPWAYEELNDVKAAHALP